MTDAVTDERYETLCRLYDDPDEQTEALQGLRPEAAAVERQRTVFGALGNEVRLELLAVLRDGERCVCELQAVLDAPQSTVATHLATLREAGLVKRRRKGKWSYYRIADAGVVDLLDLADAVGGA